VNIGPAISPIEQFLRDVREAGDIFELAGDGADAVEIGAQTGVIDAGRLDDVLKLVAKTGGIVMVNFYPGFITAEGARVSKEFLQVFRELRKKYPKDAEWREAMRQWQRDHPVPRGSVHDVVDHIEHIVKTAGIDHAGLGSDFDGIGAVPRQLEDVSCFPYITQELLNRGYGRADMHKILGGNLLRVMRQAEKVAKES
jgi:membrane dipeptidase